MSGAVAIGPFLLSLDALMVLAALVVAAVAGMIAAAGRRTGLTDALYTMVLAGLVAARIAFVVQWFDQYRSVPWTLLDIRDGGFTAWAGIAGALLAASWKARRHPRVRMPLAVAVACGGLAWALLSALPQPGGSNAQPLPGSSLQALDGKETTLPAIAAGHPVVVNLWATWCPPCRREMPVLATAQLRERGVRFAFADQSEDAQTVRRFLQRTGLSLENVLLDPNGKLGQEVGAPGLPTTLFFDAQGRLVDTHIGALSEATLAQKLSRIRAR